MSRRKQRLIENIFTNQKRRSKEKSMPLPEYTVKELKQWCFENDDFNRLFDDWEASDFTRDLTPSIDRLDDYDHYHFDNIRVITLRENMERGWKDRKNGINNKLNQKVKATNIVTGEEFVFHSQSEAARVLKVRQQSISEVINGVMHKTKGYKFEKI